MQLGFVPQCGACWINWIPAFAGMTVDWMDTFLVPTLLAIDVSAWAPRMCPPYSSEVSIIIDASIIHDTHAVIPAKAGIQQDKNAFCLNPLDSRLRGNDVPAFQFLLRQYEMFSHVFNFGKLNSTYLGAVRSGRKNDFYSCDDFNVCAPVHINNLQAVL
jgi:hypothetical protein